MSHETKIEWTDRATNPIRYRDAAGRDVWACVKVSAGCKHCYAEATALRFDKGGAFSPQNMASLTPYLRDKEVAELLSRKKTPSGSKVFVGDMTDVFGEWVPFALLDRLFAAFALRPDVIFQVLTKRPGRMAEWATAERRTAAVAVALIETLGPGDVPDHLEDVAAQEVKWTGRNGRGLIPPGLKTWPLPNVWVGTSVEDQQAADERIPALNRVPACIRFLSMEPLLGPVELIRGRGWFAGIGGHLTWTNDCGPNDRQIDWVIVGGESGHGARPIHPDWPRSIRDQCQAAGVPFFFKQWGEVAPYDNRVHGTTAEPGDTHIGGRRLIQLGDATIGIRVGKKAAGRVLDGRTWDETPEVACPSASS